MRNLTNVALAYVGTMTVTGGVYTSYHVTQRQTNTFDRVCVGTAGFVHGCFDGLMACVMAPMVYPLKMAMDGLHYYEARITDSPTFLRTVEKKVNEYLSNDDNDQQ